ncbi:MAG: glycoside hydrolase family 127 protein [Chloroflexi bacterium]|nr:glycoside hydrolase family 127 protein [Chloroflexota bacterium]
MVSRNDSLKLRLPAWSKEAGPGVNGQEVSFELNKGYALVNHLWQNGNKVSLEPDRAA